MGDDASAQKTVKGGWIAGRVLWVGHRLQKAMGSLTRRNERDHKEDAGRSGGGL